MLEALRDFSPTSHISSNKQQALPPESTQIPSTLLCPPQHACQNHQNPSFDLPQQSLNHSYRFHFYSSITHSLQRTQNHTWPLPLYTALLFIIIPLIHEVLATLGLVAFFFFFPCPSIISSSFLAQDLPGDVFTRFSNVRVLLVIQSFCLSPGLFLKEASFLGLSVLAFCPLTIYHIFLF